MIKVNVLLVPGGNMAHVSQIGEMKISRVGPVRGSDAGGEYVYEFEGQGKHHGEPIEISGKATHYRKDNVFELIAECLSEPLHAMVRAQLRLIDSKNRYIAALEAEYPDGIPESVTARMADPNWNWG